MKAFSKIFLITLSAFLASCQSGKSDVLDDLGQAVLKRGHGLKIDIEPEKE